jgi:hypothetical protein
VCLLSARSCRRTPAREPRPQSSQCSSQMKFREIPPKHAAYILFARNQDSQWERLARKTQTRSTGRGRADSTRSVSWLTPCSDCLLVTRARTPVSAWGSAIADRIGYRSDRRSRDLDRYATGIAVTPYGHNWFAGLDQRAHGPSTGEPDLSSERYPCCSIIARSRQPYV